MEERKTESEVKTEDNSVEAPVAENATTEAPGVLDLLSDELKSHKALQNYESVDAMAKSLLSAQEMVGKRVSELSAEDLISLDAKFGKPESVDGYKFEATEEFKVEALNAGLSYNQAVKLWEQKVERATLNEKDESEALALQIEEVGKVLHDEFGSQFEARIDIAKRAAKELGGEDLYKHVFESDAGLDPILIKALSEAGKRVLDHESVGTEQINNFGFTPSEAISEIAVYKSSPEYEKAMSGKHKAAKQAATEKLAKLYKMAYPK